MMRTKSNTIFGAWTKKICLNKSFYYYIIRSAIKLVMMILSLLIYSLLSNLVKPKCAIIIIMCMKTVGVL